MAWFVLLVIFWSLLAAPALAAGPTQATETPAPEEWPDTQGTPALALTPLSELPADAQGDTPSALAFGLLLVCAMGGLLVFGIGAAILMERFQRSRR